MILSASRRTDIPAFYSDWFMNRIKEGYVLVRNPMNHNQISKIILSPDIIDCIVFWTKDPKNMLHHLPKLDEMGYQYYFQFTLTPYEKNIERNLRVKEDIEETFLQLSNRIGSNRVVWRYDPIILNDQLTLSYHKEQFERLCDKFHQFTNSITISFVDLYSKVKSQLIREITSEEMVELSNNIVTIANDYGLIVKACCEKKDLSQYGIKKASCIDKELIEEICGTRMEIHTDKNQRESCGCIESVDLGVYNTCMNGCVYCYANFGEALIHKNLSSHRAEGELLVGTLSKEEIINLKVRSTKSNKKVQMDLNDFTSM